MKYSTIIKIINKSLKDHKDCIDELAKVYQLKLDAKEKQINEMIASGKYSKSYIEETKAQGVTFNELAKIKALQNATKYKINPLMDALKKELDDYINSPASSDFLAKVTAIKQMDVTLSNAEFSILQDKANTYFERRLLKELADTRTEKGTKTTIENGKTVNKSVDVAKPYNDIALPNIDNLFAQYKEYKSKADTMIQFYSGADSVLRKFMPEYTNDISNTYNSSFADTIAKELETNESKLIAFFDDSFGILSPSVSAELTENEKSMIDALIDSAYPNMAKEQAQKIAKASPILADILAKDERYADSVNKALAEE